VPLKAPTRVRGVVGLALPDPGRLDSPDQRRLLDALASLLAIALERIHYVDVARQTTVQMESERLRNVLLGAISHDLRTPLAALAGMADSLQLTAPPLSPAQAEIALAVREAALRMNSLVNNLLDMARLQSGRIDLNLQWQAARGDRRQRAAGHVFAAGGQARGEGRPAARACPCCTSTQC
jgi:two-component system sensor histidine kinase KdpD